jgi:hypothetical protein
MRKRSQFPEHSKLNDQSEIVEVETVDYASSIQHFDRTMLALVRLVEVESVDYASAGISERAR